MVPLLTITCIILDSSIKIMLKPESVSWDAIHEVIWASHEENRRNGVKMRYPSLPGPEIEKRVEPDGKMLVAMTDEGKLIGTAAMIPKDVALWFGKHRFAYCCFASILPEYNGKGIYKEMCRIQEELAQEAGLEMMLFDTHEKNTRNLTHSVKAGYRCVDVKHYGDHFNVVMVKWLNGCPYSEFRCKIEFIIRRVYRTMRIKLKRFV